MEFLYFPEDKSEYIPGIISVIVIVILSVLIVWLLMKASRKEVKQLEEQGYTASYDNNNNNDRLVLKEEKGVKDEHIEEYKRNGKES